MSKKTYIKFIKIFIVLSPLPFGCVGKVYLPLFYLSLLFLSFAGMCCEKESETEPNALLSPAIAYGREIRLFLFIFLSFLLFQIIPFPRFLISIISPETLKISDSLTSSPARFLSISLVPVETVFFTIRFISILIFFLVFLKIRFNKIELISLIRVIIYTVSFQSLFGLIKYSLKSNNFFIFFHKMKDGASHGFLTGTIGNPDHFAFYIEMTIPLLIAFIFYDIGFFESGKNLREKLISAFNQDRRIIINFVLLGIIFVSLLLTGSRSGIVTSIISLLIFSLLSIYLKRSRSIRKKIKYIFIAIAIIAVFLGIKNTTDKFMKTSFASSGRFLRWPNSLKIVSDFPVFGSGFGTYKYTFYLYDTDPSGVWSTHAHNEYIEGLTEGGVLGSLSLFLLLGAIIFSIARMWRNRRHPGIRILGIGILTSLFTVMFHSFFDFSLRIPSNLLIFSLIMLIGIKLVTYKKDFTNSGSVMKPSAYSKRRFK